MRVLFCGVMSAVAAFAGGDFASFSDVAGQIHSPSEWANKRAVVFEFVETDCPLSNRYIPEMERIAAAYASRGVAFYSVISAAHQDPAQARQYVNDFRVTMPVLLDPGHVLAHRAGARVTPEVAVLNGNGELLYRGRIDDREVDFGKERPAATRHDLREALDEILAGKAVKERFTHTIGCFIEDAK